METSKKSCHAQTPEFVIGDSNYLIRFNCNPFFLSLLTDYFESRAKLKFFQIALPLFELVHDYPRDLSIRDIVPDSVILFSVADVVSSLKPLYPHVIVLSLHLSSFPLPVCVLNLPKASVLVVFHTFSADAHVN